MKYNKYNFKYNECLAARTFLDNYKNCKEMGFQLYARREKNENLRGWYKIEVDEEGGRRICYRTPGRGR